MLNVVFMRLRLPRTELFKGLNRFEMRIVFGAYSRQIYQG